jgi:hypothetical protein
MIAGFDRDNVISEGNERRDAVCQRGKWLLVKEMNEMTRAPEVPSDKAVCCVPAGTESETGEKWSRAKAGLKRARPREFNVYNLVIKALE